MPSGLKPTSIKVLGIGGTILVLLFMLNLIMLNKWSWVYTPIIGIIASLVGLIQIGAVHYFKEKKYRTLDGKDISFGLAFFVFGGLFLNSISLFPYVNNKIPMYMLGYLYPMGVIVSILTVIFLLSFSFGKVKITG